MTTWELKMKIEEYNQILKNTILADGLICMIVAAVIIGVLVLDWVIDRTLIDNDKRKTGGKKKLLFWALVMLIADLLFFTYKCLPAIKDLHSQSYVSVHGEYYMYNFNYSIEKDTNLQVTLDDGSIMHMYIPRRPQRHMIDSERFPAGRYMGTIWYAEHSKIILEFILDEAS